MPIQLAPRTKRTYPHYPDAEAPRNGAFRRRAGSCAVPGPLQPCERVARAEGHPECGDRPEEWYSQRELTKGVGNKGEAFSRVLFVASRLDSGSECIFSYYAILVY